MKAETGTAVGDMRLIHQLEARAALLREHSLRATSEANSGHPTSCLSAADVVAAGFFDVMRFEPGNPGNRLCDQFVLSKGHAAPLLYAAWAEAGAFPVQRLLTLRQFDSELEGHPTPRFAGTVAATGSLGQGLSVGFGMAWIAKREKRDQRIFVLMGDGEAAEGSVWEAVALAAHNALDNLVAIVDVNGLGQSTRTMYGFDVEDYARRFESFGWRAIPIDGHDMPAVVAALHAATAAEGRPVAILARTIKGKGVASIADKDNWHGKPVKKGPDLDAAIAEVRAAAPQAELPLVPARGANDAASGVARRAAMAPPAYAADAQVATREAYGAGLAKLGEADERVVVIDADTKNSTYADKFMNAFPERSLEGFIAEQNMIGAAVGLSAAGKVPFVSTFACFLTRAFDHIRMAAISRANLKIAGSHCGVSIGADGPSQMGLEDLAMMRAVPGATVLYPSDAVSTERLVAAVAAQEGIHYLRLTRPKGPILYDADEKFPIGGAKVLRSSSDDALTIVAAGGTLHEALRAHDVLKGEGIAVRVVDAYSVKPLDAKGIVAAARATHDRVLTVEDHYPEGGLGDAVLNAVARESFAVTKLAVEGIPRSGEPEELLAYFMIDATAIAAAVRRLVRP